MRLTASILLLILFSTSLPARENLIQNGGFEQQLAGWNSFWSRAGGGAAELVDDGAREGAHALRISYGGQQDWSFPQARPLEVQPGEIYELTGWLRIRGEGSVSLSVILYNQQREAMAWDFGGRELSDVSRWQRVQRRFVIPKHGGTILPRLMGNGPAEVWLDDVSLVKTGTLDELRSAQLPSVLTLESPTLKVNFHPRDATISLLDKRSGQQYAQHPESPLVVLDAHGTGERITFRLLKPDDVLTIDGTISVESERPELLVELAADGPMREPLRFPQPFQTAGGEFLILPVNEGISYPVDDASLPEMNYHLFGGHGLCMAFYGSTDLQRALMTIVETPDDARVIIARRDDRLCLIPQWEDQKHAFGPARRVRYCLFETGGYVAMCKRYRQYAQQSGRFKTLEEKLAENPDVDRLVGAVNVWCWDRPGPEVCAELQASGIQRILWSRRGEPDTVRQMNEMGILTSRYDIYQDVQNPANFSKIGHAHPDWPTEAWPEDLIVQENGQLTSGWRVRGRDGNWYPCGVLCDRVAVDYARRRVPAELETHDYRCRFIDTTTAAAWRECYHERHPMTRSDSRRFRMDLLAYMSQQMGLVTGSETGHDAAVPHVHYFEGMLSLGPYRVPDAGRAMMEVVTDVPPRVAKFQTGHYYRLPLWELVYHDCVVAQWYWGDYNNKLPSLWDRRDLWNRLYGTPPMFMFNRQIWRQNRERFVQSYQAATPVARATGYHEMRSHRWLNEDHSVQQTEFANGVTVTANFGEQPYRMPDGTAVPPLQSLVSGLDEGG